MRRTACLLEIFILQETTKCIKCNVIKDIDDFYFRGANSSKRTNVCKLCHNKYMKKYRETYIKPCTVRISVPEGMKKCNICGLQKSINDFGENHKSIDGKEYHCILCNRKLSFDWAKEHPKHIQEYRDKHKKEKSEYNKMYTKEHRELKYEHNRKRRARKLDVEENYTAEQIEITLAAFKYRCFNCGSDYKLCIDHHHPLIKEFALSLDNAVVLCRSCNSKKGFKNPEDFYGEEKCNILDKKLAEILKQGNYFPNNKEKAMVESKVLTGKVCWFSKVGYGFITRDDGEKDLFIHFTNIEMEGYKTLRPGQIVSFEIGANDRGPQAIKVKVLKDAPKKEDEDTF